GGGWGGGRGGGGALRPGARDFPRKRAPLGRLGQVLAYLGPFALSRQQRSERPLERRPAARAAVKLGVRIAAANGTLDGTCVELSSTGMKVRGSPPPRAGQAAKLRFQPPAGRAPADRLPPVFRVDPDSAAFWFLDLMAHDTDRINTLVDRLQR